MLFDEILSYKRLKKLRKIKVESLAYTFKGLISSHKI